MIRSLSFLLFLSLPVAASASDRDLLFESNDIDMFESGDDDLFDGDLVRGGGPDEGKREKRSKAERVEASDGSFDFGDALDDSFDTLDDLPEEEPEFLGDFEEAVEPEPVVATMAVAPAGPGPVRLGVAGKSPMAGNYALSVVNVDRDAIVIELPVLVASSRVMLEESFLLIGEVSVGGTPITEMRQVIAPASAAEFGPTFAFLKAQVPVVEQSGKVEVSVKRSNLDGTDVTDDVANYDA